MNLISDHLDTLRHRIAAACEAAGRPPDAARLLAVSKTFGIDAVRQAMAAGQREFGENYVQEGVEKITALAGSGLSWHFIGPVQSNKTRDIAEHFDWVQSVDRLKIAQRLSEHRSAQLPPLNVCVQVNISGEDSKSGCAPNDALALCQAVAALPQLRLRGLMAIPAPHSDATAFRTLRTLYETIQQSGIEMDTLSAGMSDDFPTAVAEGATMVRIGSSIFGKREK